jgi:hypothetical protein
MEQQCILRWIKCIIQYFKPISTKMTRYMIASRFTKPVWQELIFWTCNILNTKSKWCGGRYHMLKVIKYCISTKSCISTNLKVCKYWCMRSWRKNIYVLIKLYGVTKKLETFKKVFIIKQKNLLPQLFLSD